jgi:nifR3 family TIM-barrel protein
MITIGNHTFNTNVFLAPLAGCADLSFRLIARECGTRFCFFEMIDAGSLLHQNAETISMLKTHPDDFPIGAQLLGSDPSRMLEAANRLCSSIPITLLDINSACPVRKVIKKGCGAFLLNDPDRLVAIVDTLARSLDVPITVKLRVGFERSDIKHLERIAQRCADAGAQALFIHGRTREQAYRGDIDYGSIRSIVKAVSIPVFGSGNILSVELARHMQDETGCSGILVARGAFGHPWLAQEIEDYLTHGMTPTKKSPELKIKTLKRHLTYVEKYCTVKGTGKLGFMRKIAQWYVHGFPMARQLRNAITHVESYEKLVDLIDSIQCGEM